MDLRRAHQTAGLAHSRCKRTFGVEPLATTGAAVPGDKNPDFHDAASQLICDAEAADMDRDDYLGIPNLPPSSHIQMTAATCQSKAILLKLLFNYSAPSGTGLDFYWKWGLKNLEQELVAYDLLYEEEYDEESGDI